MYIPFNEENEQIYCYDINSLYPSVMKTKPLPVGVPTYFSGDILKEDPNAFGFFYCKVKTPDNLEHPIIQIHLKTKEGIRTVSPLGSFESMLFSEEILNAVKSGYSFEIL
jgi:hypothetical protein